MEKYTEAVEDLTEAHRLNKTPEALRYLEDAKKRKIKAEKRKPSHYQVCTDCLAWDSVKCSVSRFLVWTKMRHRRRLRKRTDLKPRNSILTSMLLQARRNR